MSVTAISEHTAYSPAYGAPGPTWTAAERGAGTAELTITLQITVTGPAVSGIASQVLREVQEMAQRMGGASVTLNPVPELPAVSRDEPFDAEGEWAGPRPGPWLRVLPAARAVLVDGVAVQLTRREFDLLLFLCQHRLRVFSREQLLTHVWGYEWTGGSRTVDVHIRRLRMKLGNSTVSTVHGVGYRIDDGVRVTVEHECGSAN